MREPGNNELKAWSREYNETPFYFVQSGPGGQKRLIAWTEELSQSKETLYRFIDSFPSQVRVLLKICVERTTDGKSLWSRHWGEVDRWKLTSTIQSNEIYIFSDGMHQLCIKEGNSERYLAYDEHCIFFVYDYTENDVELVRSLGFEKREAPPLYSVPHYQHVPPDPEKLEAKFVSELGLSPGKSDLEPE